jgi:iron complex outermembrane receptor protein
MASVKYKTDYGVLYATYSQAYQSGGFDYPYSTGEPKVNPEYLTSYEVGFKGNFWGGRITPNLSAFHYNYRDLQVTQETPTGPPGGFTTNAAKARVDGVEFETAAQLAQWLALDVGGTWTDGKYLQYVGAVRPLDTVGYPDTMFDASGKHLVYLPMWTYFVQLKSDFRVGEGKLHGLLTWSWKSDYDLMVGGADYGLGPFRQPEYGLLNARVGYQLPGGRWDLAIFGNNLLNKETLVFVNAGQGNFAGTFGDPRTFGGEVRFKF